MSRKTSDVFRTTFLTMDGTFDPNNSQLFFRALQEPLNTTTGTFYSLGAAQSNDPSLRINQYDASGNLNAYGYLYDTYFNPIPPGMLLTVAGGNSPPFSLVYSLDGQNWIGISTPYLSISCLTVAYDGFSWFAGGIDENGITIITSSNGLTWVPNLAGSSLFSERCSTIAVGDGLLVAGGRSTTLNDTLIGFNYIGQQEWFQAPATTSAFVFSGGNVTRIAYNGNLWLATASQYNNSSPPHTLGYSVDGILWFGTIGSNSLLNNAYAICWNGALWIVGGDLNGVGTIIYSTNGYDWTNSTVGMSSVRTVSWNGLIFMAGGYDITGTGQNLYYSSNGINWIQANSTVPGSSTEVLLFPYYCNEITWDGNKFQAVGQKGTTGFGIAYSGDGNAWFGSVTGTEVLPQGNCIAVNEVLPFISPKTPVPSVTSPLTLVGGANPYYGTGIGYTRNGIYWTFLPQVSTVVNNGKLLGVAWNGTVWVMGVEQPAPNANRDPTLIYSYDGVTWNGSESATAQANIRIYSVGWGGSLSDPKFIAIGEFFTDLGAPFECVIESGDGITWNRINFFTRLTLRTVIPRTVVSNGTTWIITGSVFEPFDRGFYYSLDNGLTWQGSPSIDAITMAVPASIGWGGHLWVINTSLFQPTIAHSTDAINWTLGTINDPPRGTAIDNFFITDIVSNGTMFILGGGSPFSFRDTSSQYIYYSYDGIDFYPIDYASGNNDGPDGNRRNPQISSITWTGQLWVASGYIRVGPFISDNLTRTKGVLLYSYNGVTWYNSYNGSDYMFVATQVPSVTGTNRANPTAGNILPPTVLNQGLTPPNGYFMYTVKENNLYKSSRLYLDESNNLVGINQTSQIYTDLANTIITSALEISGGSINIHTYENDAIPGLYLTANEAGMESGGRIELNDAGNNLGWRIDNNSSYNNHLQITAYDNNVGTLCMDFDGSANVGIGTVTESAYRLKVNGDMLVTGDSLTSGSGKLFVIDHPNPALNKTHSLRHSCVEGPTRGDTMYRWTITTMNKTAQQSLPSYSPYLNENWQFIVRSTNSFGRGYVTLSPCETFFTLTTNEEGTYSVLGIATRKDEGVMAYSGPEIIRT